MRSSEKVAVELLEQLLPADQSLPLDADLDSRERVGYGSQSRAVAADSIKLRAARRVQSPLEAEP